jgi:hypothetical protein
MIKIAHVTSKLIIRADDAALSRGTNLAIRDAVAAGSVRNVSILGCGPTLDHAAEVLLPMSDSFCVGVHAALTSEFVYPRMRPLASTTSVLAQADGTFFPDVGDRAAAVPLVSVEEEVLAQIAAVRSAGFTPRYLDTHMGFQWIPGAEALLKRIGAAEGLIWGDGEDFPKVRATGFTDLPPGLSVRICHPARADQEVAQLLLVKNGADLLPARVIEADFLAHPERSVQWAHDGIRLTRFDTARNTPPVPREGIET